MAALGLVVILAQPVIANAAEIIHRGRQHELESAERGEGLDELSYRTLSHPGDQIARYGTLVKAIIEMDRRCLAGARALETLMPMAGRPDGPGTER